ncbi:MAG: hypothetical protein ACM34M_14435, partial [Ignavibacteria bacterium]
MKRIPGFLCDTTQIYNYNLLRASLLTALSVCHAEIFSASSFVRKIPNKPACRQDRLGTIFYGYKENDSPEIRTR